MNSIRKLRKAIREVPIEGGRFIRKQYPAFVTARSPEKDPNTVPVFMFHAVQPERFKAQIDFLRKNGYATLSLDEFTRFLQGTFQPVEPSVLLTFDDGDISWYETAYPVLKNAGMRAAGFLIPSYIPDGPDSSPWLNWEQAREMEASGVFEFASHTCNHDRVFTSARRVDFMHPAFDKNPLNLDTPWFQETEGTTQRIPMGAPIYTHAPRTATERIFIDSPEVRRQCADWVSRRGGGEFFQTPNWRQELEKTYQTLSREQGAGDVSTPEQAREWLTHDLKKARTLLHEKLGHPVSQLCFPWGEGSEFALACAREAGYESCFWVCTTRNQNHRGDNPFYIPRLKDDYLQRLPGEHRKPLLTLFSEKISRRKNAEHLY